MFTTFILFFPDEKKKNFYGKMFRTFFFEFGPHDKLRLRQ